MKSNLLLIMPLLINTFEHNHILASHILLVNTNTRQKSPHFAEMHRQTGESSIHFISRAQVFRTACFFPIVISPRSSFPMRSSRTAKGSPSGWPSGALSICDLLLRNYVNFMSIKICAENGFSAQIFILCYQNYVYCIMLITG